MYNFLKTPPWIEDKSWRLSLPEVITQNFIGLEEVKTVPLHPLYKLSADKIYSI